MAHSNNIDKSNAHIKAARMAYKMVKRQAVDEESSSAAGRQPLSTASDEDELTPTLAPGRGSAISSSVESSDTSSSTTRRTTARASITASSTEDDDETSTTESSSSTRSTSSATTRSLAPVRSTTSSSTSPTTTSAGRSSTSSSPPSSSTTRGISDTTSSNETNPAESGSKSNAGTIAGVIIAVLAVLVIAAFFGWRFWKKKKAARAANGGLGESDTFYPFGGAGASSAADKGNNNNGYNQRINSFEDLASNAAAANGYNGNGEKYGQQNVNGYGTMGGDNDNEKSLGAMAGAAGFGAMNRQRSAEEENFAGRGLSPYNSFSSFSHLPNNGLQGLRSPTSPPMNGSSSPAIGAAAAGYGSDSYPPTPQQQAHYSQQGSIFSNAPNASMMGHPADLAGSPYGNNDHLPSHQDRALGNAMDAYNGNNGNAIALGAAGAAIGAAALAEQSNGQQQQQGPFADPATEGKTYIVTRTFEPSMPDELLIYPGDRIQIVVPYDDGWCLGCNLSMAEREGVPPARGVFPRDCVEEWTPELEKMMNGVTPGEEANTGLATVMEEGQQRPTSVNSDIPLNAQADLQRAPTLPPLDMGDNSRFSMTSANNNNKRMSHLSNNNRPASLVPGQIPLPASIKSPVSATAIPLPAESGDEVEEDIYGGVSNDLTSPVNKSFAPDIQVSSNDEQDAANAKRESVAQFGSSYHIADYASRLGDDNENDAANAVEKRLSTLDEENTNDEFPSTPRTTISNATASPRFSGVPPLSATGDNTNMSGSRSPAASSARLSVAGSMINNNNNNRLSVASAMMPSSQSVKSLKRTSSLIAPQDAETFLANPTSGEPADRIA